MNRFLLLFLLLLIFTELISAQVEKDSTNISRTDTLIQKDTSINNDSLLSIPMVDSVSKNDSNKKQNVIFPIQSINWQILQHHPYLGFNSQPLTIQTDKKQFHGKEIQFYGLILLLLVYAMLKRAFPKYFDDLFRLFFRNTIKQKQLREQLIQTPLPSLLLNIFFVITGGLYVGFLLKNTSFSPVDNFWLLSCYGMLGLSIIYFIKFMALKLSGWLFNMREAADSYIFIVFLINKMIGLFLLPFLVVLAFTQGDIYAVSSTLSWIVIVGLLVYRFILTYTTVRNQVKVNPFHFFLYLCAFELAPLLLIYRGLLLFFHITA